MDIKQIQELIKLINKSNIGELTIEKDDFKITIKQKKQPAQQFVTPVSQQFIPPQQALPPVNQQLQPTQGQRLQKLPLQKQITFLL